MHRQSLDCQFMALALTQAQLAYQMDEVPVGAIMVQGGRVIAAAHNLRESSHSAIAHAEVLAIEAACRAVGDWRLTDCTLYVTLEPWPMCAGAIINSRLERLVFGALDPSGGCCGSLINLLDLGFYHRPKLTYGIMDVECGGILSRFFGEKSLNPTAGQS